jgi:hypothetical protein
VSRASEAAPLGIWARWREALMGRVRRPIPSVAPELVPNAIVEASVETRSAEETGSASV